MPNKIVFLFAALLLVFASQVFATPESDQIAKILSSRTNGSDAFLNKLLSPAKSLDVAMSDDVRIQSVNSKIVNEMSIISAAFKSAPENKKFETVFAAANRIDSKLDSLNGANIVFVDGTPSAATSRNLILIPKKNSSVTMAVVTNILSSYKHSAKLGDYIYEYADPQNLTSGSVSATVGTDTTWMTPQAAAPFVISRAYVLKKCRQLLGWRCMTSYYRVDSYLASADAFNLLFVATVDLTQNPDHSDFTNDKRSTNQFVGSTAVYMIKESSDWVMIYGPDVQWANEKLAFTGIIQKEFQKDAQRFRERFAQDLNISSADIQKN